MAAHYDTYDYPSYWNSRNYEHESEVLALKRFLGKLKNKGTIIEIGAGYGRLAPIYLRHFKKVIITEPSIKLLSIAQDNLPDKHITFIKSTLQTITKKTKPHSADVVLMVRVAHHITDMNKAFKSINALLTPRGYFVLEFANKRHLKALIVEFLKGNITFALDIFPKDIRSAKSKRNHSIPFINYHPDVIENLLEENGFKIVDQVSVSNIRIPFVKRFVPVSVLVKIENYLQKHFSNHRYGPSIFILAKKVG